MTTSPTRRATITYTPPLTEIIPERVREIDDMLERVRALLPDNYKVAYNSLTKQFMITGHDVAGWTMDDYVIPRLASGLIFAEEVK